MSNIRYYIFQDVENFNKLAEEKNSVKTACDALREALKGDDSEAIKAKQEELQKAVYAISEKVYKEAQAAGPAAR